MTKIRCLAIKLWPKSWVKVVKLEIFTFLAITSWPMVGFLSSIAHWIADDVRNRMVYRLAKSVLIVRILWATVNHRDNALCIPQMRRWVGEETFNRTTSTSNSGRVVNGFRCDRKFDSGSMPCVENDFFVVCVKGKII